MPEKIEVKKYGNTLLFLRKFMERCGYELIPRNTRNPPSEMEALISWLTDPNVPLAKEYPEFGMARDMVMMFKFLATMESREEELMRRRIAVREYASWNLSFEEGGRRGWLSLHPAPLRWELVGVRGTDLDTADIEVLAFGERKLMYGEGPVVHSPSDPAWHLDMAPPVSEEDVLHSSNLPTFGGTLSREESEMLMSYLTVEYVRIPLVLGFFATRDRVTYLFNTKLQNLVRGVTFEPGAWIPQSVSSGITHVPVRQTASQKRQARIDRFLVANLPVERQQLGTESGLLLNELACSPMAVINPLLAMLDATKELTEASVYSPDASFLLFITLFAIDVQTYVVHVIQSTSLENQSSSQNKTTSNGTDLLGELQRLNKEINVYLHETAYRFLSRWCAEAETENDILTTSVVHSYLTLLWTNSNPLELSTSDFVRLTSSLCYVRNWHEFGLGMRRSDLESSDGAIQDGEQRLLRFLQAQGIDTARVAPGSLQKYLKGRPLFLNVGRETIKAPTIGVDLSASRKLPPVDVPEERLFSLLQKHRAPLVKWLDRAAETGIIDDVLRDILRITLRTALFEYSGWKRESAGHYVAIRSDLRVDIQTAEVMWRRDNLKPVPDSMSQFTDFETLFSREALHCGLVSRPTHRHWVHIVGTEYDLIEWDPQEPLNQGVG
jgi:hypothetical protein